MDHQVHPSITLVDRNDPLHKVYNETASQSWASNGFYDSNSPTNIFFNVNSSFDSNMTDFDFAKKRLISVLQEELSFIWIIFGTIGNMLSLFVLLRRKMRIHSTFTYLTILSLMDTFVLYFGLLRDYMVHKYKVEISGDLFCKFHVFSFYFVLHMASWLLVAVNVDRLIASSFLSFSKKWCTPRMAIKVSVWITVSLALLNSHFIYYVNSPTNKSGSTYHQVKQYANNSDKIINYNFILNSSIFQSSDDPVFKAFNSCLTQNNQSNSDDFQQFFSLDYNNIKYFEFNFTRVLADCLAENLSNHSGPIGLKSLSNFFFLEKYHSNNSFLNEYLAKHDLNKVMYFSVFSTMNRDMVKQYY
jgi:hypothetical protein